MSATAYIYFLSAISLSDPTYEPIPESASDPFAFLRPIDVYLSITTASSIHTTSSASSVSTTTIYKEATLIDAIFTDDFSCDEYNGWSHCNIINYKYHGPFNTNTLSTISRTFQCKEASSSTIHLSFSIAFDCNNAFSDELTLFMDDDEIAHFNPFPIDDTTTDTTLLSLSPNCDQWFIRHISQSLSIPINQSFDLQFASLLKSNIGHLVIYDLQIECIVEPTYAPTSNPTVINNERVYINIDEDLICRQYFKGNGLITNISTVSQHFIAFRISINNDIELDIFSNMGSWTFAIEDRVIQFYSIANKDVIETYPLHSVLDSFSSNLFWISWSHGNIVIGMGHTVNRVHDIIIVYRPTYTVYELIFAYAIYNGADWTIYDYVASGACALDVISSTETLSYVHRFSIYNGFGLDLYQTRHINTELWQSTQYLMFEVQSMDTVYIELKTMTTNESLQIIFNSHSCDVALETNNISIHITKPITMTKQVHDTVENVYCTQYANYDPLLNWTFWIYWDNNQLLIGNGRQIGNSIIHELRDTSTVNNINTVSIASISESEWTFYSAIETLDSDVDSNAFVMNRESDLFCKRYYTHSSSKSQISKLNTMVNDDFVAFSVRSRGSSMDNAPQIYLSYWNTQKNANNNNNNNNDFNIDNHWWWSVELQIAKQQIFVANNSESSIAAVLLPSRFRIKDDVTNCYLDITFGAFMDETDIGNGCCRDHGLYNEEMNVFWNCDGDGHGIIWRYDDERKRIYYSEYNLYLIFGEVGSGFEIAQNDRNAKVSPYTINGEYGMEIWIKQLVEERYRISSVRNDNECQLSRSDNQYVYKTLEGKACFGYEAVFKCGYDAAGIDLKLIIASLSGIKMNDWTSIWMTSFGNDNIKIGVGDLIGNEEDVVFSLDYDDILYETLSLQYIWIDSMQATNWIFYDYDTSAICDAPIIRAYNVSRRVLPHNIVYSVPSMTETFLSKYLWNDQYLMFNISSFGDAYVWIKFEMKTDDVFIIEYGADSVKDLCEDTRGITDHVVILKNAQYKYCSAYSGYDLSLTYSFWIYWKDNKLEIGNGDDLGQSVITALNEFNHHDDIDSISIGSDNDDSIWRFYTIEKHFTLHNVAFAPNDVLSFTFKYDKLGILQEQANISITSPELNIKCVLMMDFSKAAAVAACRVYNIMTNKYVSCNYKEGGIKINIPNYKYIRMHQTFDSQYLIKINSADILLGNTQYSLKRNNFMNVSIHFVQHLTIGSTLRIASLDINNNEITQNSSSITITCSSLGIVNAKVLIHYATDSCLICITNGNCNSCSIGIPYTLNITTADSSHILLMQSDDTHLAMKRIEIYVHPCDIGFGLVTNDEECTSCPVDHFNLNANDNECKSCSSSHDFHRIGYECRGSSHVVVDYNWWIVMSQYSHGWQYMFAHNHTAYDIISSICPPLFCCQHKDGCLLKEDGWQLCANNRDPNIALCGGCLDGYSEVYGSTACKECAHDHYLYLFILLLIALLYAICISFVCQYNGDNICSDNGDNILKQISEFNYSKLVISDSIKALLISLFRPMTYFYQSINMISPSAPNAMPYALMCLVQLFTIDISINISSEYSFCFVSGLTALSKEVWLLFIPFCLFLSIALIWMLFQCGASSYLWKRYRVEYSPNFVAMIWSAFLLSMTTISCRLFKIAACTSMGNLSYIHFYAPQHQCFDAIWYLGMCGIIMIVAFWMLIWYKLYTIHNVENEWSSPHLHHGHIISPYKDAYWYWEFVLILRRIMISALVTFKYINEDYTNLILGAVLFIYLLLHFKIQPFKHKRINNMESLCLFILICSFAVINFAKDTFCAVFISCVLLLPFALFMTRIYATIKLFCSMKYSDGKLDENQQETLLKVINRLHESQRNLIKAIMHRRMPHIMIANPNHNNNNDKDESDDEMTYFHSNSPGAMPRIHRRMTEITPTISTITPHIMKKVQQTKGEESASLTATVATTYSSPDVPGGMRKVTRKDRNCSNIIDYHQFVHKIETKEYSSTLYDDSVVDSKSDIEITLQLISIMNDHEKSNNND